MSSGLEAEASEIIVGTYQHPHMPYRMDVASSYCWLSRSYSLLGQLAPPSGFGSCALAFSLLSQRRDGLLSLA